MIWKCSSCWRMVLVAFSSRKSLWVFGAKQVHGRVLWIFYQPAKVNPVCLLRLTFCLRHNAVSKIAFSRDHFYDPVEDINEPRPLNILEIQKWNQQAGDSAKTVWRTVSGRLVIKVLPQWDRVFQLWTLLYLASKCLMAELWHINEVNALFWNHSYVTWSLRSLELWDVNVTVLAKEKEKISNCSTGNVLFRTKSDCFYLAPNTGMTFVCCADTTKVLLVMSTFVRDLQ